MRLEMLINRLIHPVFLLLTAFLLEIAVFLHEVEVAVYHIPHLGDSNLVVARISEHFGRPATGRKREKMKRVAELSLSKAGAVDVVAIGLVDDNAISHLHDAALNALQLIARSGKLNEQEEIDHRVYGGLALPYSHGLNKNLVESGSLAEHDSLACLSRYTTERTGRGAGANESIGVN